jgi:hypothetical protein
MYEPDFDEYWDDEGVVCGGTCISCERLTLVVWCVDPFVQEIHNRDEYGWWCAKCHWNACQDI